MTTLKALNSGLSFFIELAMLAAFAVWGFSGEWSPWLKWGLGLGLPVAVALLWGLWLAPTAKGRLKLTGGVLLSSVLFALAALALYLAHHPALALVLAGVALVNRALVVLWQQW